MRKLMWFTVGFAVSCVLGIYLVSGIWLLLLAAPFLFTAVLLCFVKRKPAAIAAAILFGLSVGLVWLWGYNNFYLQTARQYDGETISGVIEISDYSYDTDYGIAADGMLELDGKDFRVRVYLNNLEEVSPGDRVEGDYKLRLTTQGGQQEATYHQADGIFLLAYAKGDSTFIRAVSLDAKYFAAKLRRDILNIIASVFPEDTRAFARALLLGDSTELTYEEDTAFKVSGIRHIIAVSGLHVAIVFALVYMLAGRRRVLTALLGIPVLVFFAAVAGFTPSIVRACIMQSLMMLAMLFHKEYDPPTALSFAVLVMLGVNPMAITSVSLQLSVCCIIGMLLFSKRISDYILRYLGSPKGKTIRARLARWLAGSMSVTLSATLVTTPLCAYYFGMVSLVGVLTNLLTLWVVSFIFYGIMLACVLGAVWASAGKLVAAVISWPIRFVLVIAKALSSFPLAAVYTCSVYIVVWLVFCYLMLAVFLLSKKKRPAILMLCVGIGLCVSLTASYLEPRLDHYRVTVMDVGQGQSILLQSDGKNFLVDCGGDNSETAADTVAQQLLSQGVTRLDGLILTHYDEDHAGGVPHLLTQIRADTLYLPNIQDDSGLKAALSDTYSEIISWINKTTKLSGEWGEIVLIPGRLQKDENESSLCVLFQVENYDILITGDRNSSAERKLLEQIQLPELDLLVVGHHGSKSSTSLELLSVTKPKMAVISVGEGNSYGHPADEVLYRLELFACEILRTDLNGTIIIRG